jgi:hypothetical protein
MKCGAYFSGLTNYHGLVRNEIGVHGFKGPRLKVPFSSPDCIWDAHLRESVSLVRPNPKFGAKLAIIWENEHF